MMQMNQDPGRLSDLDLHKQTKVFLSNEALLKGYDAVNSFIIVLNEYRQLIYANKAFLEFIRVSDLPEIMGKRPGEVLSCINAWTDPNGCGRSDNCAYCQIANLLINTIKNTQESEGEVFLTVDRTEGENTLTFYQKTVQLTIDNQNYYVVTLEDISDRKAKALMEKVFFHDILNTSGGVLGLVRMLKEEVPEHLKDDVGFLETGLSDLTEAIQFQRQLIHAEKNEIVLDKTPISAARLVEDLARLYSNHFVGTNKTIKTVVQITHEFFNSDYTILKRVLENMIKNALEATKRGSGIVIGCKELDDNTIEFWVSNDAVIPLDHKPLIFKKGNSSKDPTRGFGTYSMKLFGERVLGGKVRFTSEPEDGTTFYLTLPV